MAKKQSEDKKDKKVFNFGDSPLLKKTEQTVVEGYQRIEESEEKGGVENALADDNQQVMDTIERNAKPNQMLESEAEQYDTATSKLPAADPEETKGIQAYIPMSLYERLVMRKLRTKEPLGSMFQQAMQMWIDVQEGKLKIVKP